MAYLAPLQASRSDPTFGTKATGLAFLERKGFPVPETLCVSWRAREDLRRDATAARTLLRHELLPRIDASAGYAIRSSANLEDTAEHSFAGQFTSLLDVHGLDAVLAAIEEVWASVDSPAVRAYLQQCGRDTAEVRMGVLIQKMVPAVFSGVAFSRNPFTGAQETILEAIEGRGDRLVQAGGTPERWVGKWGGWRSRPKDARMPEAVALRLVLETEQIARAFGRPVDLEWVYDGSAFFWVQLRPISTGAEVSIYSRRMAKEMLPGLITPLVWSLNIPLVNGAWLRILEELIGALDIEPESLARMFYYRAYFNMGVIGSIFEAIGMPRESLELLMGIEVEGGKKPHFGMPFRGMRHIPRLIRFGHEKWHWEKKARAFVAEMPKRYAVLARRALDSPAALDALGPEEILACIDELFALNRETAYMEIITPLLFQMYHRALRGRLAKAGIAIEECDLTAGLAELKESDPASHLARLHGMFEALAPEVRERIEVLGYAGLGTVEGTQEFAAALEEFLRRFGHLSDSGTEITAVPWREDPGLVLRMISEFTPPSRGAARRCFEDLPRTVTSSALTRLLYRRCRSFQLLREQTSSLYTYGYGLFRPYFLALGRLLVLRETLTDAHDVFYLRWNELRDAVSASGVASSATSWEGLVRARKQEMEKYRSVTVPETIYGDREPPILSGENTLRGVPTSRGYYVGPARVVKGLQDLPRVRQGDVLVVPFSDVSWTPLFARAGAVVAESGGMLSHSSIIAREYGIPAVVSVPGACAIADGALLAVDAFEGIVMLETR